jgi:SAM-dependent methyltransferase
MNGRSAPQYTFPSTSEALTASPLLKQYWYYAVEFLPGVITPGQGHLNFGLTRRLFGKCDVADRSVLDIGTMEAAILILAHRRSAKRMVGVDADNFREKINAVKHYTGAEFEYFPGLTHGQTLPFLKQHNLTNFDVVVLSGLLYHCFGPLHTLAMARSLVRTGGLMIVETWSAHNDELAMFFNSRGRFSKDPSTFFVPTVPLLDYVLRFFKLLPIDWNYGQLAQVASIRTSRVAIACRAINEVAGADDWMEKATGMCDYRTLIDWDAVDKEGRNPVGYDGPDNMINLAQLIAREKAIDLAPTDAVIKLTDRR